MKTPRRLGLLDIAIMLLVAAVVAVVASNRPVSFGQSPTREKVSRVRSDLRSLSTAIESYAIDNGVLPPSMPLFGAGKASKYRPSERELALRTLGSAVTTPISYLKRISIDVWAQKEGEYRGFGYFATEKGWMLFSAGPDQDYDITDPASLYDADTTQPSELLIGGPWTYDPTNGSVSSGDIWRVRQ